MRGKLLASAAAAAIVGSMASPASAITYAQYTATYTGGGQETHCNFVTPCFTTGGPFTTTVVFTAASQDLCCSPVVDYSTPQTVRISDSNVTTSISPNGASTSTLHIGHGANFTIGFSVDPSSVGDGPLPYFDTAHLTGGTYNVQYASTSGDGGILASARIVSVSTVFSETPFGSQLGASVGIPSFPSAPEPSAWVMMLAGFGVVGFAMRRRVKVRHTASFA